MMVSVMCTLLLFVCSEKSVEVFLLLFLGMLKADSHNVNLVSTRVSSCSVCIHTYVRSCQFNAYIIQCQHI